jgi:hypothetical protein
VLIDDRGSGRPGDDRSPVQPNWRVVGFLTASAVLVFAATHARGLVAYLIVCAAVYAMGRAVVELVDYGHGLREWRQ